MAGAISENVNIILLGHSGTGKTHALLHFRDGMWPRDPYVDTTNPFEVDIGPSETVSVRFWDFGGGKEFEQLNLMSYPAIDCVILFCKAGDNTSYDRAKVLANEHTRGPTLTGKPVIIIDNKNGGSSDSARVAELKDLTMAAATYELSIKNDLGKLREAFHHAIKLGQEWRAKNRAPAASSKTGDASSGGAKTTAAFTIKVIRALLHKAADSDGSADPYVKVGIKRAIVNNWLTKTKVIKKNMNPIWDHCATVPAGLKSVDGPLDLYMELWDEDTLKDDFMGSATLQVYFGADGKPVEIKAESVTMKDKKGEKVADLFVSIY